MDRIVVKGLVVQATVGVSERERSAPQRCRVDLELAADLDEAGARDDLDRTIDYGAVVAVVRETAAVEEARLLEALAARMVDALFDRFGADRIGPTPPPGRAVHVKLRLVKLDSPLDAEVEEVGVEVERTPTPRRRGAAVPPGFR